MLVVGGMVPIFEYCLACITLFALPQQQTFRSAEEAAQLAKGILATRSSIGSVHARVVVEREEPQDIVSRFFVAQQDDCFRFDQERVKVSYDNSQEGTFSRSAAVGPEVRKNHSEYGAELNLLPAELDFHVDLRVLGLYTVPFANLTRDKRDVGDSIVARILADIDHVGNDVIEGIRCIRVTHERGAGSRLSFFCEAETGRYRGCEAVSRRVTGRCWIEESKVVAGIDFPTKLLCTQTIDGSIQRVEKISLSDIEINVPISLDGCDPVDARYFSFMRQFQGL
jgi:hypothetical protein